MILLLQAMASKSGRMPPLLARTMKHLYTSHKEALQVVMVMPSMCPDVSEMLSSKHTQEKSDNRQCLLWNIHFLSRIGLVFQGDGDEADSNSMQLLSHVV